MAEDMEVGPVDYLVVEWPPGSPPNGEALPHLIDLVDRGVIRVLDFAFVEKDMDGGVFEVAIGDFDGDGTMDLAMFEGASSGLLDEEDYEEAGNAIEPGAAAAIVLYENTWAAPFATALRKSGAQLVASGRIPINAIIAKLDELEAAEA
ncbi:MAG TPA: DUF6325 family protein [Acidimicrobiia bacterium]|jgi:hypothetical protein|nr:DUF6325 family protein [Acidimicrobiia bacterium]